MDARQQSPEPGYQAALEYLWGRLNFEHAPGPGDGRHLRLDRMRQLLQRLGHPEEALRPIHVAGTKGKGSTAAFLATILTQAGYRTGLYTSPHLNRLEERIRINGQDCSEQELVELVAILREAVDALDREAERTGDPGPTFFEITTAMALLQFARRKVEATVIEVGLGGRLDSTNVIRPAASVITTISYDHTRQLGNTLPQIARAKAGIIKPQVPVICGVTDSEPRAVIEQIAAEHSAPAVFLNEHFSFSYQAPQAVDLVEDACGSLDYETHLQALPNPPDSGAAIPARREGLRLRMLGAHQAANAAVALATIDQLRARGWSVPESAVRQGLAETGCPARIEVVSRQPTVVLDTAHNTASIQALVGVLEQSFAARRRILVFGATKDKDVRGMLKLLLPGFESVILTRWLDNPRAVAPTDLRDWSSSIAAGLPRPPRLVVCDSPVSAWECCRSLMTPAHLVCVTGSFFLAGEMRGLLQAARTVSLS